MGALQRVLKRSFHGSLVRHISEPVSLHGGCYDIFRKVELKAELDSVEPRSDVVLDLSKTELLDCSCLGVLVGKLRQWRERDPETQLRLIHVAPRLARILSLVKLDTLFVLE